MHTDEHRKAGGDGQGLLHPFRHRRRRAAPCRGHRGGDGRERAGRRRCARAGLHGHQRVGQGREDHPELRRHREHDGVEKGDLSTLTRCCPTPGSLLFSIASNAARSHVHRSNMNAIRFIVAAAAVAASNK